MVARNQNLNRASGDDPTWPGVPFNITPNDAVDLTYNSIPVVTRGIEIAAGGTLKFTDANDVTDTITVGEGVRPYRLKRVWATGTTATGITGITS